MIKIKKYKDEKYIITKHNHYKDNICLEIQVNLGSFFDPSYWFGISHFLEHLLFRQTSDFTKEELVQEWKKTFYFNAFTGHNSIFFEFCFLKKNTEDIFKIISSIFFNSIFDETTLNIERDIIIEELKGSNINSDDILLDNIHYSFFKDSKLNYDILGTLDTLKNIDTHAIELWYYVFQQSDRIFSISGNIEEKDFTYCLDKYFCNKENPVLWENIKTYWKNIDRLNSSNDYHLNLIKGIRIPSTLCIDCDFNTSKLELNKFNLSSLQSLIIITNKLPGYKYYISNKYLDQLLDLVLFSDSSSYFFQKIREEKGYCYSLDQYGIEFFNFSLEYFQIKTSRKKVKKVISLFLDLIDSLHDFSVFESVFKDLNLFKDKIICSYNFEFNIPSIKNYFELDERIIEEKKIPSHIMKVTIKDLYEYYNDYYNSSQMKVSIYY